MLDEAAGEDNLEYIPSETMGNTFTDVRLVFFVRQRTGGFAYGMEIVSRVVAVVHGLFYLVEVACFLILQHFHQHHSQTHFLLSHKHFPAKLPHRAQW